METGESKSRLQNSNSHGENRTFEVLPEKFDAEAAHACLLLTELSGNRFSYALIDKTKALVCGLGQKMLNADQSITLRGFLKANELFRHEFAQVLNIEVNRTSTLIPEALFTEKHCKKYLQLNSFFDEKKEVGYNKVNVLNSMDVYQYSPGWKRQLLEHFNKGFFIHHSAALIESLGLKNKRENATEAYIHLTDNRFFDLVVFDGGKLQLYNNFYFEAPEDVLYYTLYAMDQLDINTESCTVQVLGYDAGSKALWKLLERYTKTARLIDPSGFIGIGSRLQKLPLYLHYNLLNSFLCA